MKTFIPQKSVSVEASKPHPEKTFYKISIGTEFWDNFPATVLKIQMEYNGRVEGRKSPSYPIGTDDYERVSEAIKNLMSGK